MKQRPRCSASALYPFETFIRKQRKRDQSERNEEETIALIYSILFRRGQLEDRRGPIKFVLARWSVVVEEQNESKKGGEGLPTRANSF